MSRRAVARAPGKVIIAGEHFVVSGAPAVAAAIDVYATARAVELGSGPSVIYADDLGLKAVVGGPAPRELAPLVAVVEALRKMGYDLPPFEAHVSSEIPGSAGLGSSAAVSAALALALSALAGDALRGEGLFSAALEGERAAHGNPSGVDPAAVVYGGVILYRRGRGVLGSAPGLPGLELLVADSGVRRSTGAAVGGVQSLLARLGGVGQLLLAAAEGLVGAAWDAIVSSRPDLLGDLMNVNHGLLSAIGVSTPELDELVHLARRSGALGAKLTGAGLGGSVIAVAPPGSAGAVLGALAPRSRWARRVSVAGGAELLEP